MLGQPLCQAHLVIPIEPPGAVRGKLDIIWRIGIDKVGRVYLDLLEISARELPTRKNRNILVPVIDIVDGPISPKRDVVLAPLVVTAQPIVARAIEIVKQLGSLSGLIFALTDKLVKAETMLIVQGPVVLHRQADPQPPLKPPVKVDQVAIDIVEQRFLGPQPKRHSHATHERFH
jgi:hypothetical protein